MALSSERIKIESPWISSTSGAVGAGGAFEVVLGVVVVRGVVVFGVVLTGVV